MIVYDLDYCVFVLNNDSLGFIITKGLEKVMSGEAYTEQDIVGRYNTG